VLASARDRARLRQREEAERARVERVLARGPREVERRGSERDVAPGVACRVCGEAQICVDDVGEGPGQGLRLARCRRCDFRWTERVTIRFVPRFRRTEVRGAEQPGRRANGA